MNRRAVIKTAAIVTTASLLSSRLWAQKTTPTARPQVGAGAVGAPVVSLLKPVVETTAGKVRGYSLNGTDIGENLARRHDVVVVTPNHRLNLFGFLALGELGGEKYADSANVPMIIGSNQNESVNAVDNPKSAQMTDAELMAKLTERYHDQAAAIAEAYRKEYPRESPFGIWAAVAASDTRRNAMTQAEKKAALGAAPAFEYIYAWRTTALEGRPGTFHSAEISMVFDNADKCVNYSGLTPESLEMFINMSSAWANFARTGNPNHPGIPNWPAFEKSQRSTMVFNTPCMVKDDPEGPGLRLLEG